MTQTNSRTISQPLKSEFELDSNTAFQLLINAGLELTFENFTYIFQPPLFLLLVEIKEFASVVVVKLKVGVMVLNVSEKKATSKI